MSKIYQKKNPEGKSPAKGKFDGFTLIELLVVVLIIGILAVIAWPKYQVTVFRSKLASTQSTVATYAQALELYYMENGEYPSSAALLSINKINGCEYHGGARFVCGDIMYDGWYSPAGIEQRQYAYIIGSVRGEGLEYLQFLKYSPRNPNERYCAADNAFPIAKRTCKSTGGVFTSGVSRGGNFSYYRLP